MTAEKKLKKEPLRQRAEKLLSEPSRLVPKIEEHNLQKLVHELQVHQIELEMQNEELWRAQEEIEESRQKYSDLYDFAPIGYFTFSPAGEILEVNLTGASLLGVERKNLIHRPFSLFVEAECRSHFRNYCRNVLSTDKTETCQLKLIRDDGKSFDVSLQSILVRNDNTLRIRCAVSDITELKETQKELKQLNTELEDRIEQRTADLEQLNQRLELEVNERRRIEEVLRESEKIAKDLIKHAPTGIYEVDVRIPRFTSVNDVMCQFLGYTREELLQMSPFEIMDERNASLFRERVRRQGNGEKIDDSVEYKVRAKDSREHDVILHLTFTYEDGKPKGAMVIAQDITERKQAEEALRVNEERLHAAIAGSQGAEWQIPADERREHGFGDAANLSPQCKRLIGFADEEFPNSVSAWRQRIHPNDLPAITTAARAHIEERTPFYNVEYRIRHKDGSWRYLFSTGRLQRDPGGRPLRWIGLDWDITARKRAEEALKNAYDELERRVEERTSEVSKAVELLRAENTQRRLLEETLRESEAQVRFFASQCLTAQETERKRVAAELHDSIAASISAVKFRIENIAEQMKQGNAGPGSLDDVSSKLMEINNEVRRIMADLRPSVLDDLGIIPAIDWLCREYQKTYSHISVEKQIRISDLEVPNFLKTPIFRICQEGMNNIARHSQASRVNLSLLKEKSKILLKIQDNGQGFDLETVKKGMGLSTMKERAQLSGGSFELESDTGKGTTVCAVWTI